MKAIIALIVSVGISGSPIVKYWKLNETKSRVYYREDRKLKWADFTVISATRTTYAAEIHCQIDMEVIAKGDDVKEVNVFCYMVKQQSWVVREQMTDRVLSHEQGHFDIADKFSRMLIERLKNVKNEKQAFDIYDEITGKYQECQGKYDSQTKHGLDIPQQKKWDDWIRGD